MDNRKIPFTKEGFANLKKEFAELTQKRKEAVISLRTAREMGDLSENAAYKVARFELGNVDRRLRRLTFLLKMAVVPTEYKSDCIVFGSKVTLTEGDKKLEFTLVSDIESNPAKKKLSFKSPIGKAILGKQAGDKVVVNTPSGNKTFSVISID